MAVDCELITLVGEIDMVRTEELRTAVEAFRVSPAPNVEVDVSGVTFCGSEGVGFLARLAHEARTKSGTVTVLDPDAAVTRLIEISGLDGLIHSRLSLTRAGEDQARTTAPAGPDRRAVPGLPGAGPR
jgi:anti-sigma B factor antagonist